MKKQLRFFAVCFAAIAVLQILVYFGTRLLPAAGNPHDLHTSLDDRIPLSPPWITVYMLAFVSWAAGLLVILASGRPRGIRACFAYGMALLICGAFFLLFPCTMERPEVVGEGFFPDMMRLLYRADEPNNLFPSMHVLASYCCWRGMAGCRKIPRPVRTGFFVSLILVCFSVVLVKQHVLADIPAAIAVAELCFLAARSVRPERILRFRGKRQ